MFGMQPDDRIRIQHMLDAAQEALSFSKGLDRHQFSHDRMRILSVIKSIEIIGEAAKNVSKEVRQQSSEIAWQDIAGMRDRLTHAYFDINLNIVWETIQGDLPLLVKQLATILEHN
jgi:uncharacterized protein with HEPN domain